MTNTNTTNQQYYDLVKTLKEVSKIVDGSDNSVSLEDFKNNYLIAKKHFDGKTDWVRFTTFDAFKEAITSLIYCTMIYIYSKNGSTNGVSENTGFTIDFTCAYSWWNAVEDKGPFLLDGKFWDYELSFVEVRQTLAAGEDWYEIRLISQELVNMQYDLVQQW